MADNRFQHCLRLMENHKGFTQENSRKQRRGIIEKRRRDRINNSLSELRRLIPNPSDKMKGAKVEKTEILQMAVEHIKILNLQIANSNEGYTLALCLEREFSRSLGYQECANDILKHLSTKQDYNFLVKQLQHVVGTEKSPLSRRSSEESSSLDKSPKICAPKPINPSSKMSSMIKAPCSTSSILGYSPGSSFTIVSHPKQ